MIKVLVNGAFGKMGSLACRALDADDEIKLVGKSDNKDDLASSIKSSKCNVVLDFTSATVAFENAQTIINSGVHPVIGTSGISQDNWQQLNKVAKQQQLGGIIAPNFSISAMLMLKFSKIASKYFADVEIIEQHHKQKIDSPSGTAIRTAEIIANNKPPRTIHDETSVIDNARGAKYKDVNIHSIRIPGVIAKQEVIFSGLGDVLSITQNTTDRSAFMPGVILACKQAVQLKEIVFGLENLL